MPALRRPDLHLPPLPRAASRDGPDAQGHLRHPVHLGQLVRAADELAHHGAGRVGRAPRATSTACGCGSCTTALLGATFVGGQVYEFTAFYREGLGYTTSLFGSSFYTLTGFHGAHVTVGIIMLLSLVSSRCAAASPANRPEVVELIGLYWHFVDIVWIVIFTLVYLIPA